ncbi:hypothetical protein [Brevibacillus daliensis]|uniref:hypothetical protein n=1 Tax=Brevibacillus daliensis TaxID=2892995 RepID=UPI001E59D35D|nr:hypothetical protein [Brevibacillus daliensis]
MSQQEFDSCFISFSKRMEKMIRKGIFLFAIMIVLAQLLLAVGVYRNFLVPTVRLEGVAVVR